MNRFTENFSTIRDLNDLYKKAKKYDYISFDIFDTLIKRDISRPVDIFSLIEDKYQVNNFCSDRIKAEQRARQKSRKKDINLDDIYDEMPTLSKYKEIEKNFELNECTVNLDIFPFYKWAIANKKVIIISDIYLDKKTIEKILHKNGINGYQNLYISNEENLIKSDGSLFKKALKDNSIEPNNVLHIGNSLKADFLGAKKAKISAIKIPTYKNRKMHEYNNVFSLKNSSVGFLNSFINNHTNFEDNYEKFGYEIFGPLLFGFSSWLIKDMKNKKVKKVLFMSRDGFILKKAYDNLGFDKLIPSFYFEASRRSLRVPNYSSKMSFEEMVNVLTVPNLTNLKQIFDSWGLDINKHLDVLKKLNLNKESEFKRDQLKRNPIFKQLFIQIKDYIFANSEVELANLKKYLKQINFNQKIAIVDIGWGGSMQKFLNETLNKMNISTNIVGYYVGLTKRAQQNLGSNNLEAYGYAFDRLNNPNGDDLERPFVGLFETLFLEQNGSVMKYSKKNNKVIAVRYPYEYLINGDVTREVIAVKKIQLAALDFVMQFSKSYTSSYTKISNETMFSNLYQFGVHPIIKDVNLFGNFNFFNDGTKVKLADPKNISYYLLHVPELRSDLYNSQWKIGFLKKLLKLPINYVGIFKLLHKIAN